jgi:hypothetical protein
MTKVVIEAHCPAAGVNVYVVVAALFKAGVHIPEYPLFEVLGSGVIVPPMHTGATAVKVGVILGLIVIVNVVVLAHCPAIGVKV